MFFVHRVTDTIGIPPESLSLPTRQAVEQAIDDKYPGRVWMDIGLVVARYNSTKNNNNKQEQSTQANETHNVGKHDENKDTNKDNDTSTTSTSNNNNNNENDDVVDIQVRPGVCVAGDAVAHVTTTFSLIVFRPFLEEVCIGTICASTALGIQICLGGFFDQIFVPAFWMLRPTHYEPATGLWVWTPEYDDDEDEEDDDDDKEGQAGGKAQEEKGDAQARKTNETGTTNNKENKDDKDKQGGDEGTTRYEMEIGSTIRFKVKSIQFARVTQTAKGRQATLSTTDGGGYSGVGGRSTSHEVETTTTVRRRSSSVSLKDDDAAPPPPMKIMASICEDGLGLVSWWESADDNDEEDEEAEQVEQVEEDAVMEQAPAKVEETSSRVKAEKRVIKQESL